MQPVSSDQEANQDRKDLLKQTIENAQQATKEMQQVTEEARKTIKALQATQLDPILHSTKSAPSYVSKESSQTRCSSSGSTHVDYNQEKASSTGSSCTITTIHSNYASSTE